MDNNIPQQPTSVPPLPQQAPAAPAFQPVVQEEHKSGMRMIGMLFVIIVMVIGILAGGYWYMSNQVKETTSIPQQPSAQKDLNKINSDLGSVNALDSEDKVFTAVDADTEKL